MRYRFVLISLWLFFQETACLRVPANDDPDRNLRSVDAITVKAVIHTKGGATRVSRRRLHILSLKKDPVKRFFIYNTISYVLLQRAMVSVGPVKFIQGTIGGVFGLWLIGLIGFDNILQIMERYFLTPRLWEDLLQQPLTLFGGAFSHMDIGHLIANAAAFKAFAPMALSVLGASSFSNLYLFSICTSQLCSCLWESYCPDSLRAKYEYTLGASGAISGIVAYCCLLPQKFWQHYSLVINNKAIEPYFFLIFYIIADTAGLLRIGSLKRVAAYLMEGEIIFALQELLSRESSQDSSVDTSIGYSAHIGGALGGILFYSVSHQLSPHATNFQSVPWKNLLLNACILYSILSLVLILGGFATINVNFD